MNVVTIINLTPHDVRLFVNGVCNNVWPASMFPARSVHEFRTYEAAPGIPVQRMYVQGVEGLPDPQENTLYIVSTLILDACPDRLDLIAPDSHPRSRVLDHYGEVIGVRRFRTAPRLVGTKVSVTDFNPTVVDSDV